MEELEFDPSEFEVSDRANPSGKRDVVDTPYNVKFNFKTQKIEFTPKIANEINLMNNSLAHAPSRKGNGIAIIVAPKDQGVFAKGVKGKNKGLMFTNRKLAEDLVAMNLTSGTYSMEKLTEAPAKIKGKEVQDCLWYKLTMVGEPKDIVLGEEESEKDSENEDLTIINSENTNQ
jgi:hypothetical protein